MYICNYIGGVSTIYHPASTLSQAVSSGRIRLQFQGYHWPHIDPLVSRGVRRRHCGRTSRTGIYPVTFAGPNRVIGGIALMARRSSLSLGTIAVRCLIPCCAADIDTRCGPHLLRISVGIKLLTPLGFYHYPAPARTVPTGSPTAILVTQSPGAGSPQPWGSGPPHLHLWAIRSTSRGRVTHNFRMPLATS